MFSSVTVVIRTRHLFFFFKNSRKKSKISLERDYCLYNLFLKAPIGLDHHRMTEWFGLEGTLLIIQFQHSCHRQGHLPLDQVAQSPVQPALNTAREGAATASLGNLCQGLTTLIVKNFFLISNLNLPSFSLKPLSLVLSCHALVESPSPALLQAPSGTERLLQGDPTAFSSPG